MNKTYTIIKTSRFKRDYKRLMKQGRDMTDLDAAIVTGGGEVKFENAETNWVKNAEGGYDLLLRFTEGGSYTLPGVSQVRLLAVGGGRNMA